jgi:phosphatidate cytidylyltransferase
MAVQVSKELAKRVLVSVVGIPLLIGIFYQGGLPLYLLLGLVAFLGWKEFNKILLGFTGFSGIVYVLLNLAIYFVISTPHFYGRWYTTIFSVLSILVLTFPLMTAHYHKTSNWIRKLLLSYIGLVYIGILPALLFRLDSLYRSTKLTLLLLIMIWLADSAAYFIGMKYGKHRGIFRVSPMKSTEGFVAGLLAPMIFCAIIYMITDIWKLSQLIFIAFAAGLVGQAGDLLESKFKRMGGVKDSSNIIPGHGGVLDRFDSLLLAGPVLYYLLKLIP